MKSAFGERLKHYRVKKGFSQTEFAKRSGFNRTYIRDIECGQRNLSLINIAKLAYFLDIETSKLFEGVTYFEDRQTDG